MEVIIADDAKQMSRLAARIVAEQIRNKPNSVIGTATGSTPVALYDELVRLYEEGELDLSGVRTFALDEYVGLDPAHEQSYRFFMNRVLFHRVLGGQRGIKMENTHVPDGLADDIPAHCEEYEGAIAEAGGIDLQILGIGPNGHIGFNEPGSSLRSRTRIKRLSEATVRANARFFERPEEVPRYAITMGIGTIRDSRIALLLAGGHKKARAIAEAIEGPMTHNVPASVLQDHHYAVFIVDRQAARYLSYEREREGLYRNGGQLLEHIDQLGSYAATRRIPAGF